MIPLGELKYQHQEIGELIKILSLLLRDKTVCHTNTVFNLFEQLFKKLEAHFKLEGKTLYPELLTHEDRTVREVATQFLSGTSVIDRFFAIYLKNWKNWQVAEPCENPSFFRETEEIFTFLKNRIKAEDEKFFPIVDKLTSSSDTITNSP